MQKQTAKTLKADSSSDVDSSAGGDAADAIGTANIDNTGDAAEQEGSGEEEDDNDDEDEEDEEENDDDVPSIALATPAAVMKKPSAIVMNKPAASASAIVAAAVSATVAAAAPAAPPVVPLAPKAAVKASAVLKRPSAAASAKPAVKAVKPAVKAVQTGKVPKPEPTVSATTYGGGRLYFSSVKQKLRVYLRRHDKVEVTLPRKRGKKISDPTTADFKKQWKKALELIDSDERPVD